MTETVKQYLDLFLGKTYKNLRTEGGKDISLLVKHYQKYDLLSR